MLLIILSIIAWVFIFLLSRKLYSQALLVVVGAIPTYIIKVSLFGLPTNFFEVSVLALLVSAMMNSEVRENLFSATSALSLKIKASINGFILAGLISTYLSDQFIVSLGILKSWVIIPLVMGWLVLGLVSQKPQRKKLVIDALLVSGSTVSIISFFQLGTASRLFSIYDVPNSLALWLSPLLVISFWLSLKERRYLVHSVLMSVGLLGTLSVAGIGSTLAVLVAGVLIFKPPKSQKIIIAIGLLLALAVLALILSGRLAYLGSSFQDAGVHTSLDVRAQLWSIGLELVSENPLLGVGLGQFEPAYQQRLHQHFTTNLNSQLISEFVFRDPHNWVISFWLNMGVIGLISFAIIIVSSITGVIESRSLLAESLTLAFMAILVFGSVDTIYWKNDLAVMFWVLVGLASFVVRGKGAERTSWT